MASNNDPCLWVDALSKYALQVDLAATRVDDGFTGRSIAIEFAHQAARSLTLREYTLLLDFLKNRKQSASSHDTNNRTELKVQVETAVREFYSQELQLSHQNEETLARPAGFLAADLGVVLHLETKDDNFGDMFHDDSATIGLLKDKGVKPDSTFGMDWHWRGESREQFQRRRWCVFGKLRKELRDLHDNFSRRLLERIPAPFLVTGSACARDEMRRRLPSAQKLIVGSLEFDLDYRSNGLRRIILRLPHPAHGFFSDAETKQKMGNQLDTGWNFMLWVVGQQYSLDTFRKEYGSSSSARLYECSPVILLWHYRRKESEEDRKLRLREYSPSFLRWAENYLRYNPSTVTDTGNSLVDVIFEKYSQRLSHAAHQRERKRKRQRLPQSVDKPVIVESIQGRTIHVTPAGYATIQRATPLNHLRFRISIAKAKELLQLPEKPYVHLTVDSLNIRVDEVDIYTRHLDGILSSGNNKDWLMQIMYETRLLGQSFVPEIGNRFSKHQSAGLRRKLFRGENWSIKNKRCVVQDIEISLRSVKNLMGESVFLQAELVAEGYEHPEYLCSATIDGDPGRRLGLRASYQTDNGIVQMWIKLKGENNAEKVNTLVDLLDGRERDWTAEQPRRQLKYYNGERCWKSSSQALHGAVGNVDDV